LTVDCFSLARTHCPSRHYEPLSQDTHRVLPRVPLPLAERVT
jgi:hypothetical protein